MYVIVEREIENDLMLRPSGNQTCHITVNHSVVASTSLVFVSFDKVKQYVFRSTVFLRKLIAESWVIAPQITFLVSQNCNNKQTYE